MNKVFTVSQLAEQLGGRVHGDDTLEITALAPLQTAGQGQLSFFANPRYIHQLQNSDAAAVLVRKDHVDEVKGVAIEVTDPYLAFAEVTHLFDWRLPVEAGIAASAQVDAKATVAASAQIGAGVVIESGATIGERVCIGANTVIGRDCVIGDDTRLEANVSLYANVRIGSRGLIHSGVVLGADGFGFAPHAGKWVKICQLGGVVIGDDVEIGANTTVDRGAMADTTIGNGVILDNQIQIAHNVQIGDYSAIAGCTAVAGSTKIGRHCQIAGMSGITGHLEIADGTHVTAMTLVSKSINKPGAYSSGTGLEPHQQWKRNVVRFRQLDDIARRVRKLEDAFEHISTEGSET